MILNGWPNQRESLPTDLRQYFNVRDEFAAQDGVIFKGPKCIIPMSLRLKIQEKLHRSYINIQGCLRRAREVVHWPNMNRELQEFVSKSETCNTFQPAQDATESHNAPGKKLAATYSQPITSTICEQLTITQITSRLTSYTRQRRSRSHWKAEETFCQPWNSWYIPQ